MMVGQREDRDPIKTPIENPRYGTFEQQQQQPSAPPLLQSNDQHGFHQHSPAAYHPIPAGYQSNPYHAVVVEEGIPVRQPPLPCCGIGIGWALFLSGFFLASVPWYVGVFLLMFVALDYREKPGLVACTVAAVLAMITFILKPFQQIFGW